VVVVPGPRSEARGQRDTSPKATLSRPRLTIPCGVPARRPAAL